MDPSDRPLNFIPRKFNSLRQVRQPRTFLRRYVTPTVCFGSLVPVSSGAAPAAHEMSRPTRVPLQVAGYKDFVKERFERCLDLYLCPRAIKKNVDVDPDRYSTSHT